jgi:hypothetical protein
MKFNSMSESEIQESMLWADGEYRAKVFDASEFDKNGNPLLTKKGEEKIDLTCTLYNDEGKTIRVSCVLTNAFIKLLKHLCDANDLVHEYNSNTLSAKDCLHKTKEFLAVLGRYTFKSDKTGELITMNTIKDFKKFPSNEHSSSKKDDFNDDIEF